MLADAGSNALIVKETIGHIHDPGMHAVLRVEQRDGACCCVEPFEHGACQISCSNNGRKLAIIADQHESPGAQDQAERERFGQLAGFINDRHLECA